MIRSKRLGVVRVAALALTGYACSDSTPTAVSSAPRSLPAASFAITSQSFTATDLGTLGGTSTSSSIAHDINSAGTVVGESSTPGSKTLAFIWTRQAGMTSLGLASATDAFSRANAINNAGWIVGASGSRPVLWKPGQQAIYLEPSGYEGTATDINNNGVVVGIYERNGLLHGFRWDNGTLQEFTAPGGEASRAFGINDLGNIVGGADNATTHLEHPAIWSQPTNWVSLGVLEALNGRQGAAHSINSKGEIVGFFFPQSGQLSAFVFRPGTGATALTNGTRSGDANSINDASQIVGSDGSDAILWDPSAGRVPLPTLGGSSVANDINGANQIVGRSALPSGQSHATLWELKPNVSPVASIDGPASGMKKKPLEFSAEASSDADGDVLTFSWDFGDGSPAATGSRATHEFGDWGKYTVTVTVSDASGNSDSASLTVTIAPPGQLKKQ